MPLVAQILTITGEPADVQLSVKSMNHVTTNENFLTNSKFSLHAPDDEGWMEKDFRYPMIIYFDGYLIFKRQCHVQGRLRAPAAH